MSAPVVLDLETQFTFREVGGFNPKKLKVSLAGLYDYTEEKYFTFTENELPKLFPYLEKASFIIGFNIFDFDLPVLGPYYVGNLLNFTTCDLMTHVQKSLGFRLSLDDLAKETLQAKKNGHGLLAVEYFRNGEMDKLREYCLSDVRITRELYEYGKTNGKVYYKSAAGRQEIPVSWGETKKNDAGVNLTLPW